MSQDDTRKLEFPFRGRSVPVTHVSSVSPEQATLALASAPFQSWYRQCERLAGDKRIDIHSVEIQSVDLFGPRVGFVKIKSHCTLVDQQRTTHHEQTLPGICFLRGDAVGILVALVVQDQVYSLLVDQARIPVGQASFLEIPAGMMDDATASIKGVAVHEMEEECGIVIQPGELVDLTKLASHDDSTGCGIVPSAGGCDERIRLLYLEKSVTPEELETMQGRLQGLQDEGEFITLRVVPMQDIWKKSVDAKALCALYLLEQLRKEGKLPPLGELATPLHSVKEPTVQLNMGVAVPQLAFGLYKVPPNAEGERVLKDAIAAGYRHFDTATYYNNEQTLGVALHQSGLPRSDFFVCSKVWNDAQRAGRPAVRESILQSAAHFDGYLDLALIHWPIPGFFVETYKELEVLQKEGKVRAIGLSNFNEQEYEELIEQHKCMTVPPAVNQMEVSAMMYRPDTIQYFQDKNVVVSASKALHRADSLDHPVLQKIAKTHAVTPAQVLLRWGLQKGLIVVAKTAQASRMRENRSITHFSLLPEEISLLDGLTTQEDVQRRHELEAERKTTL